MIKTYLNIFWVVLQREFLLRYRHRQDCINPLLFFILVAVLFPLATTPDPKLLSLIGPGVIWVAALLAVLLSLNSLFQDDARDGTLEQLALSPYPLALIIFAKLFSHWAMQALPLIFITPLLTVLFHLNWTTTYTLMISLLIGTPLLTLIGGIGAALTVGLKRGGLLLALIVLPLFVPTLIFGTSATLAAETGMSTGAQFSILGALLALALTLMPVATAFVLRIGLAY